MRKNKNIEDIVETFEHVKEESRLIAKKDFVICHNDYFKEIKKGDDISDVPPIYIENLKTENVI